jgi:hypothetical protein
MSSIEEEDEPTTTEEITIQHEKLPSERYPKLHHSPSIQDWDSELSESEQEFDDNDDDPNENGEERAANRALQNFMQTSSKTVCILIFDSYRIDNLQSDHIDQGYLKYTVERILPKEIDI